MNKIHIASRESQFEYEEPQARAMWEEGKFAKDSKYWKPGMPDWQPLSSYFRSEAAELNPYQTPASSPDPLISISGHKTYTKSPRLLTRFLLVMLWVSLGCEVISILSDSAQYLLLNRVYTEAEGESNDLRQQVIALFVFVIFLTTAVAFLKWIRRANLNCRGFGADDMRFTPGWSIGWYFVPFFNLVRPYQAMKEIWQVSHNPNNWKMQPGSSLLGWWWAFWLFAGFTGQLSFRISAAAKTIDDLKGSTVISLGEHVVSVIVSLLAIALVRRISSKQEEWVADNG